MTPAILVNKTAAVGMTAAGAIIIGERCPYCTKFRSPLDFIWMPGGVKLCTGCWQSHEQALEAIATGSFNGRCSECDKPVEELRSANAGMYVHFENGLYRAMCPPCSQAYVPKRMELYGETEFGRGVKQAA